MVGGDVGLGFALLVAAGEAGFEHIFFQAAVFEEVLFEAADELIEEIVCLVDQANYYVGDGFGRPGFEIGPIGLI